MKKRRGSSERRKARRSPRQAIPLKEYFSKSLAAYAVTAGAAGVGLLAMAEPTKADIIYTPTNLTNPSSIDLNHDGTNDFNFQFVSGGSFATSAVALLANGNGNPGAGILCIASRCAPGTTLFPPAWAAALPAGSLIGPSRPFANVSGKTRYGYFYKAAFLVGRSGYATNTRAGGFGPWATSRGAAVANGFLGLRFSLDGQAHYGWAELSISFNQRQFSYFNYTLTGYAYETNANQSLLAGQTSDTPEPGTLGLLALGSLGLGFWRRRKQESATSDK